MRLYIVVGVLAVCGRASAADPGRPFYRLSPTEYAARFAAGEATPPAGAYHARVVWYEAAAFPRARGRVQSVFFRGKTFAADGTFTNRFPGMDVLPSRFAAGESWVDGSPATVMEYPLDYPIFGHYRDELRQIAPDVWLGRAWDRTKGRSVAWFVLSR